MKAPRISFEFFPPRTVEQQQVLETTWQKLAPLRPEYLSVTFGAGGSTLEATRETVEALSASTDVPVAPHISCMVESADRLRDLLNAYRSKGVNRLLQEGAKAVLSAQDILDELNLARVTGYVEARETLTVTGVEAAVLAALSEEPQHVDEIRERCDLPVAEVSSTLAMLELKGMVRQVGNMIYVRA